MTICSHGPDIHFPQTEIKKPSHNCGLRSLVRKFSILRERHYRTPTQKKENSLPAARWTCTAKCPRPPPSLHPPLPERSSSRRPRPYGRPSRPGFEIFFFIIFMYCIFSCQCKVRTRYMKMSVESLPSHCSSSPAARRTFSERVSEANKQKPTVFKLKKGDTFCFNVGKRGCASFFGALFGGRAVSVRRLQKQPPVKRSFSCASRRAECGRTVVKFFP